VTYCLDSWAVLRWLEGAEPAASRVEGVLSERPLMSWINAGEVFYVMHRLAGREEAREVLRVLRSRLDLELPDERRVVEAATIKAQHRLAFADAFAMATALGHDAVLMTGDPELLDGDPSWSVEDLR
jgi:predicted nucleic acid-binding protein